MRNMTVFGAMTRGVRKGFVGPIDGGAFLNATGVPGGGWFPLIREAFAGGWQKNCEVSAETSLSYYAVYSCVSLIAGDIGKLRMKLMKQVGDIWQESSSPSFSPVINKPNRYSTRIEFLTQWMISQLVWGNTYVWKERDNRNVVTAMYVLNPRLVYPLVAPDGSIFYQLGKDNITGLMESIVVPQSEIIHDRMNPLFHPLVGVPPLYACGLPAMQGLQIQHNSERFFRSGANPSGIITVPGSITQDRADKMKTDWATKFSGSNAGAVAVLPDGLKFTAMTMTSVDAQLIEQLKISAEQVCSSFHVPAYKAGVGPMPSHNDVSALNQLYYDQCLHLPIEKIETCLTEGLALPNGMAVQLDVPTLLRMDNAARIRTNAEAVKGGIMKPNEARAMENLGPVEGGDTPYLQQQNFALSALAKRDALPNPFVIDRPTTNPTPSTDGAPVNVDPSIGKGINPEDFDNEFSAAWKMFPPLQTKQIIFSEAA